MAHVGRKPSSLSPAYRTRLRRVSRRAALAEDELRGLVLAGLADTEPLAAIARELGVTKQVLWARVQSWQREREIQSSAAASSLSPSDQAW